MFVDEAAYVDEDLFNETILPLLGVEGTALIAISTPLTEANFFTKLVTFKGPDGEPFFKTLHIGLVCKKCLLKPDLTEMLKCPHEQHKLPPWKSGERQEWLRFITENFDNAARGARENYGIPASSYMGVLPHEEIRKESLFILFSDILGFFRGEGSFIQIPRI